MISADLNSRPSPGLDQLPGAAVSVGPVQGRGEIWPVQQLLLSLPVPPQEVRERPAGGHRPPGQKTPVLLPKEIGPQRRKQDQRGQAEDDQQDNPPTTHRTAPQFVVRSRPCYGLVFRNVAQERS